MSCCEDSLLPLASYTVSVDKYGCNSFSAYVSGYKCQKKINKTYIKEGLGEEGFGVCVWIVCIRVVYSISAADRIC